MALRTQGFSLSALPKAPSVPANIGRVDVKGIYDMTKRVLEAQELVRTAPKRMALVDSGMETQLARDEAAREVLPVQTELVKARAPLAIQETGMQQDALTRQKAAQDQAAAQFADFTDAYAEAQNLADFAMKAHMLEQLPIKFPWLTQIPEYKTLLSRISDSTTAARQAAMLDMRGLPSEVRTFGAMTSGMTPDDVEIARRIRLGLDPRASSAAIGYREVMGADGIKRLVATDPREVGAQVVGTGEGFGSGVGRSDAPTASPDTFRSPTIGEQRAQAVSAEERTKNREEARAKLPIQLTALETAEQKTSRLNDVIDQAIERTNGWSSKYGSALKAWPGSEAMALASLLETVRANMAFEALGEMRRNSPTGGALGNVSNIELSLLESAVASLRQALDSGDLIAGLERVKRERADAVQRMRNTYDRDVRFFGLTDEDFTLRANEAAKPLPLPGADPQRAAAEQWLRDNPNDPRAAAVRQKLGL